MSTSEERLRKAAEKSIKAKRGFKQFLGVYLIVNLVLVGVWAFTGQGYFWPAWVMFGMGIALLFSAWDAYGGGRKPITDDEIDREMRKLKGD